MENVPLVAVLIPMTAMLLPSPATSGTDSQALNTEVFAPAYRKITHMKMSGLPSIDIGKLQKRQSHPYE